MDKLNLRNKYSGDLDKAWVLLDKARSFGEQREVILNDLLEMTSQLLSRQYDARLLEEVLALTEFVYYERDRSSEIYRLRQGVQYLEEAIEQYATHMDIPKLANLEYILLGELLNLFLTGGQIPSGRVESLNRLIERGEKLLGKLSEEENLLKAKCFIALGEALKEKAMVTEDPVAHVMLFGKAREYCKNAISLLSDLDQEDSKYFLGMAYRHLAVTFELEGDISPEKEKRKQLYREWQRFSYDANRILSDINEYTTRAYALINLASSNTRIYEIDQNDPGSRQLLEMGKSYLEEAIKLFRKMKDFRGLGWAYYHLCENTRYRLEQMKSLDAVSYSVLLSDLESYANRAVSALKHTEDHLGLGLAYTQLGIVLYLAFLNTSEGASVKIEMAVTAFQEGIKNLQKTGFYRGTGVALRSLAECQFTIWEQSNDIVYLSNAIQSLTQGLLSLTLSLKEIPTLTRVYKLLQEELFNLL